MNKNNKAVSKLIFTKKKSLILALVIAYLVSLILFALAGGTLLREYRANKTHFIENDYIKYVPVTLRSTTADGNYSTLEKKDVDILRKNELIRKRAEVSSVHRIKFGIPSDLKGGSSVFLTAYSGPIEKHLTNEKLNNKTIYPVKSIEDRSKITLNIPIVESAEGGFTSSSRKEKAYKVEIDLRGNKLIETIDDLTEFVVSYDEFLEISRIMQLNNANEVQEILIYVKEIAYLDEVVKEVEKMGYSCEYALKYYDESFTSSINLSVALLFVSIFLLALGTGSIIVIVFRASLHNAVGDIAILKHLGYSVNQIAYIYTARLRICLSVGLALLLLINILVFYEIFKIELRFWLYISAFQIGLTVLVLFAVGVQVRRYAKQSPLKLLKEMKREE
ncbi:hypothetical protein ACR6HW_04205 [Fusibacter sp. JL298sf-3]